MVIFMWLYVKPYYHIVNVKNCEPKGHLICDYNTSARRASRLRKNQMPKAR